MSHDPGDSSEYRAVQHRLKRVWNEGVVKWGNHAQQHMQDEGNDDLDVHNVIKFGRITCHAASEYDGFRYRYTLRGISVDGFNLRLVIDVDGEMMIVTCFVE